jgi:hypothetical protein
MPRRNKPRKSVAKKTKIVSARPKFPHKEMRFNVSLVILIGMIVFSMLLLLISLNRLHNAGSATAANSSLSEKSGNSSVPGGVRSASLYTFQSGGGDFQLSIPATWKGWAYRTGKIKSPVSDSLSDDYVRIFLPSSPSGKAADPNLDNRYTDMITVLTFSAGEWKKLDRSCRGGDSESCDAMGAKLADTTCSDDESADCVYSYRKRSDCPGPLEDRCKEVDGITESFQLK